MSTAAKRSLVMVISLRAKSTSLRCTCHERGDKMSIIISTGLRAVLSQYKYHLAKAIENGDLMHEVCISHTVYFEHEISKSEAREEADT